MNYYKAKVRKFKIFALVFSVNQELEADKATNSAENNKSF